MKTMKRVIALLLAAVMLLTLAACHGKDEVAITSGDYEITSAMYSYYLVMADSDAKQKVGETADTTKKGFSYYKQTIDGVKFETYVKEQAIEKCLYYITLQKLCDENKIKLDDETVKSYKSTAEYYWNYGYGNILSENGVSYATYEKLFLNDALYSLLFDHIYGEDGEKAVSDKSISAAFNENYAGVYMLSIDYSEDEKVKVDDLKKELKEYQERIDKGEDFAKVKADFDAAQKAKKDDEKNNTSSKNESSSKTDSTSSTNSSSKNDSSKTESSSKVDSSKTETSSTTTSSSDKEDKKPEPKDKNITVLTSYEDTYTGDATYFEKFANVKKLKEGKTEIIDDGVNKVIYLVQKKDVTADKYYLDELKEEIIYLLKSDEFDDYLADYSDKLKYEVNDFAIGQFKVKKIYDGTEA